MIGLKYKRLLLAFSLCVGLFVGCNNNPSGPGGSIWAQGTGVTNVNHFYASGRNLLASTYCAPCSQAYIFISKDEGSTWYPLVKDFRALLGVKGIEP